MCSANESEYVACAHKLSAKHRLKVLLRKIMNMLRFLEDGLLEVLIWNLFHGISIQQKKKKDCMSFYFDVNNLHVLWKVCDRLMRELYFYSIQSPPGGDTLLTVQATAWLPDEVDQRLVDLKSRKRILHTFSECVTATKMLLVQFTDLLR